MKVVCDKCQSYITEATFKPDPEVAGSSILSVFHHGEVDTMKFDQEWVAQNQDFWFLITNGMCIGHAFSGDREYDKSDVPSNLD